MRQAELFLPVAIGDYSDFFTGIHHATNMGRILRPDNPLLPNYKWVPIGYHGRSSSIVVSGTPVRRPAARSRRPRRPAGVRRLPADSTTRPSSASSSDPATRSANRLRIEQALKHVFGVVLLNDWSARDIQAGNTSRSGRSSPRASPPPSRPGS